MTYRLTETTEQVHCDPQALLWHSLHDESSPSPMSAWCCLFDNNNFLSDFNFLSSDDVDNFGKVFSREGGKMVVGTFFRPSWFVELIVDFFDSWFVETFVDKIFWGLEMFDKLFCISFAPSRIIHCLASSLFSFSDVIWNTFNKIYSYNCNLQGGTVKMRLYVFLKHYMDPNKSYSYN